MSQLSFYMKSWMNAMCPCWVASLSAGKIARPSLLSTTRLITCQPVNVSLSPSAVNYKVTGRIRISLPCRMIVKFIFIFGDPLEMEKMVTGMEKRMMSISPRRTSIWRYSCIPSILTSAGALKFSQHAGRIISFILDWLYHLWHIVVPFPRVDSVSSHSGKIF